MPIPKRVRRGETYSVTMMEFRSQPGEVVEAVRDGATVEITKQGRHIATMVPPDYERDETIIIRSDGTSADGRMPFTWRRPELLQGDGY